MCKIGEIVVVGGVRRSALISLSNLNDDQMAHAKSGAWWENEGINATDNAANNSVAYKGKPEMGTFMREWVSLYESKSGERGLSSSVRLRGTVVRFTTDLCNDTDVTRVHPHRMNPSCGAQTLAPRSSSVRISSVTCRKWSCEKTIRSTR